MESKLSQMIMGVTPLSGSISLNWLGLTSIGLRDINFNFNMPTAILWLAGLSSAMHLWRQVRHLKNSIMTWIYSFFNAKKYLSPISDKYPDDPRLKQIQPSSGPGRNNQKSYAVIYGASNKAGKSFAYYLMSKGFNLILIERDGESIQQLEDTLRRMLPEQNPIIIRAVLSKFD
jgi:hypothetical protein